MGLFTALPAGSDITTAWTGGVEGILLPALTDYSGTFAFTASTTNPTKGNGTWLAKWCYVNSHVVYAQWDLVMGSTSTKGTGNYSLSLPVAAAAADGNGAVGFLFVNDSASAIRPAIVNLASTTTVVAWLTANGNQLASTSLLGTFTSSKVTGSIVYEV